MERGINHGGGPLAGAYCSARSNVFEKVPLVGLFQQI